MVSTRQRIILTIVLFTLLATLTAGGISLVYIRERIKTNTYDFLTESVRAYGHEMNTVIIGMEATVDALSRSIIGELDAERIDDQAYFYEFSDRLERIANQFDNNTIGAMSVYARFDPARTYSTSGFFHADTDGDGLLERQTPTDLSIYEPTDREHVGWFYEPLNAGKAIWMNPYYNANINIDMLSYIEPIQVGEAYIGVVGVDLNFDQLRRIVQKVPKVGRAFLLNADYEFLVHERYQTTQRLEEVDEGRLMSVREAMEQEAQGIITLQTNGSDEIIGYSRLMNGWTVAIIMTADEAFVDLRRTVIMLMGLNLLVLVAMLVLAYGVGRYLDSLVVRNSELEDMVEERTEELVQTNNYLEESLAELENHQAELTIVNGQLEDSLSQLKETQQQLVTAEKLATLGQLVAGVAHEINTPLGIGITLNSFIVEKVHEIKERFTKGNLSREDLKECADSTTEASELALKNLEEAAEIVENFKQVAVDQASLEIREINLNDYIEAVVMNIAPKLKGTSHQILIACDKSIVVKTFPGALSQIITNLTVNALMHGFEGMENGVVNIQVERINKSIELIFKDNGRGIPSGDIERVMTPFYSTRKTKGIPGLGLHIVHNLVTQNLNGTFDLTSEAGEGVEARIVFPENISEGDGERILYR